MRLINADALINTLNEKNIPVDVRVNYEIMNAPTVEPDGDLISRQDAINAVTRAIWHYPNECYKNLNTYEVAEALVSGAIKSLPSAESHYTGCSGCIHYDQEQTAPICYDCKRCYKDMYEDGEA